MTYELVDGLALGDAVLHGSRVGVVILAAGFEDGVDMGQGDGDECSWDLNLPVQHCFVVSRG